MKKTLLIIASAILMMACGNRNANAGATAAAEEAQIDSTSVVQVGDKAPAFVVEKLDGTTFNLADHAGDVVWVNFWATWCPPCREELKRVEAEIIEYFAGKDFVFIPISRGEETETVKNFLAENGYSFIPGLDPEKKVYDLFATNYIPRNYIIDKEGNIAAIGLGYEPAEFDELVKKVEELLNE
ncbi:MAG: TlpA family protein disulfide reductase [Tidjanibacter sp.]|nr:TlpA family protein disulfide reductase [Tidjanibacter sp.]